MNAKNLHFAVMIILLMLLTSCERDVIRNVGAGDHSITKNGETWIATTSTSMDVDNREKFSLSVNRLSEEHQTPFGRLILRDIPKKEQRNIPSPLIAGIQGFEVNYISYLSPFESTPIGNFDLMEDYDNYLEITHLCKKNVEGFLDMAFVVESEQVANFSREPSDTLYFKGDFAVKLPRK